MLEWAVDLSAPPTVMPAQQWAEGEGLTAIKLQKHHFALCCLDSTYEVTSGGTKINVLKTVGGKIARVWRVYTNTKVKYALR